MADKGQSRARLSYRKKVSYALAVTTVFFLLVEGLLAIANFEADSTLRDPFVGFESSVPLFVEQTRDGGAFLQTAEKKLAFFNAQRFPKSKPEYSIRIFCLGGSTTYGRPYDDNTSFTGWLRELLPIATTGQRWEVINAGGISYASYRVAATMEELCDYSPDLFIVYTGHNEFLEERTYRDHRARPAGIRHLSSLLHHTRTYTFAQALLRQEDPRSRGRYVLPGEVDAILDHASGPTAYHRDDELRADILGHFTFNLTRMVAIARSAGAEIIFITPASNLKDFSPFKSEFSAGQNKASQEQCVRLLAEAVASERRGELGAALDAIEQATAIDDRLAALHFRAGRLLFAMGQFNEARTAFVRAIDEDVCPLRAVPETQRIVARVAVGQRVQLVDFDGILRKDCLHRYGHESPGSEYFFDHVHPKIATHGLLAIALVESLIEKGIVTPNQKWKADAVAVATQRIDSRVDDELRTRALTNLAQVLSWAGKQELAGPIAAEAVRLRFEQALAEDPESLFYAAVHLAMTGSNERATELLEKVTQQEPGNAEARWRLAALLYDQARHNEAEHHFKEAVRLNPADAYSHHMLGVIALRTGQYRSAITSLQRADALSPNEVSTCAKLASAFQQLGQDQDAMKWYRMVIHLNAGATRAHRQLGLLLMKHGRLAEAIAMFERVRQLDPNTPGLLDDLEEARRLYQRSQDSLMEGTAVHTGGELPHQ